MAEQVPTFYVREDSTEPFVVQLQKKDPDTKIPSAVDLSAYTKVDMRLQPRHGSNPAKNFDTDGAQLSVLSPETEGKVEFLPADGDWDHADREYDLHYLVTDGTGKISSYPSTDDALLKVRKAY